MAEPFAWLEGCWHTASEDTKEIWTRASDDLLFGFNTLTRDGEVVFFEQLHLRRTDGGWSLVAAPNGQAPVAFALSEEGDRSATFLNRAHDAPQRIQYVRSGSQLTATASLENGDRQIRWIFEPCQAQNRPMGTTLFSRGH
ncbi:MAG: DUF6265 family protein [Pseudomonadota bacterium]